MYYRTQSEAMTAAYALAASTGKRVWRHMVESKYGVPRWIVSFIECRQTALQELTD